MKRPIAWGVGITLVYLAVMLFISRESADGSSLNNMAGYLSGFFAPLAWIWFVVALFVQIHATNENAQAIKRQEEILAQMVSAMARQAGATEQQALIEEERAEFEAAAVLTANMKMDVSESGGDRVVEVEVTNERGFAEDVTFSFERENLVSPKGPVQMKAGQSVIVKGAHPAGEPLSRILYAEWTDRGKKRDRKLKF